MNKPYLKQGLVLLAVAVVAAGCAADQAAEEVREVARNVRVLDLNGEEHAEYLEISGPVAPVSGTWLSAQESGPVIAIAADKGEAVARDGVIVEQDREILRAEREAAAAALAVQEYNVDKVRQLHEAGKVSRIELLTAEGAYAEARSRARVAAERHERAAIRAPFAGVVTERAVELGELVNPGQRVVRLIDPYTLKLEGYLTDGQVAWVRVGDEATVLLGGDDEPAAGRVRWVGLEADRMTGKFAVEIEIPNPELRHHSGVIGRARLVKARVGGVVAIPRDAVVSGRVGPAAFVVEGDRAAIRNLELGTDQGVMVMVRRGLKPGDRLVVRGHRELRDGSLVKVTEVATAADGSMPGDPAAVTGGTAGVWSGKDASGTEGER